MNFINIIILSLIISIDSFILCFFSKKRKNTHYFLLPFIFSSFQISFLLTGYLFGNFIKEYIQNYLSYTTFIIFSAMGLKLITDTLLNKGIEREYPTTMKDIALQAIITSCDSLFLGIPLSFENLAFPYIVLIIGSTTFIMCLLGLLLRNKIKDSYNDKISLIGAIILFIFALKSLI